MFGHPLGCRNVRDIGGGYPSWIAADGLCIQDDVMHQQFACFFPFLFIFYFYFLSIVHRALPTDMAVAYIYKRERDTCKRAARGQRWMSLETVPTGRVATRFPASQPESCDGVFININIHAPHVCSLCCDVVHDTKQHHRTNRARHISQSCSWYALMLSAPRPQQCTLYYTIIWDFDKKRKKTIKELL